VRLFDLVRRDKAALPTQKLAELARMFDLWDLRSFRRQNRRERAWNAATRLLPALTWMVKYDYKKQLYPDIAAGVAVSFLIVPQARPLTLRASNVAAHGCPRGGRASSLTRALSPCAGPVVRRRGGAACHPRALCVSVCAHGCSRLSRARALMRVARCCSADTDFVPLFLYFAYGSSMYLQIGAVAIVSLLTQSTIACVFAPAFAASLSRMLCLC
jgi:hypothetical protein